MKKRPCWVEISTAALEHNFLLLSEAAAGAELLAIVKANAYGHGLDLCVPAAAKAGAQWLGVTSVEEGVAARTLFENLCEGSGTHATAPEILVIGGPFQGQGADVIAHRLTAVVWERWQLDELEAAGRDASCLAGAIPVHLELDTGMSRQGVGLNGLGPILDRLSAAGSPLRLDGVMTHLYAADECDGITTGHQMKELAELVEKIHARGFRPAWLHVGNSAASLSSGVIAELRAISERFGVRPMLRPGLALYGLAPAFEPETPKAVVEAQEKLQPVLEWKTQVVTVRSIAPGQVVGYNGTFVATEPMRLALLAIGYADGLKRALSNQGSVLILGERAPIVGRISMDQTVVDVTDIAGVAAGDEAVIIGAQGSEYISAEDHACWAGTIPWEIFTSITARVQRIEV